MKLKKLNSKIKWSLVPGLVAVFVGGFFLLNTYAQQMIDSFTDTSKIANTWNIEVSTSTGEVKLAQKTCDNNVWFCYEASVCNNTLGDGAKIVVKRTNEASSVWKTSQTACDTPQCGQDGAQDGDNLVADNTINFSLYPARNACKTAGGRLPTKAELSCIYTNRLTFGNNFGTDGYWSSEEYNTTHARYLWFMNGNADATATKNSANLARCVRGW